MRVIVLTGDHKRHAYLCSRLRDEGHQLLVFQEKKEKAFNESNFDAGEEVLVSLHKSSLETSLGKIIPEFSQSDLEINLVSRGALKTDTQLASMKAFDPELVLVYGSGIITSNIIEAFEDRIIGSHQGLPQYYRGSGSNFFAFLNGEASRMGISLHFLDSGIDTGAIITQKTFIPSVDDSYYTYSAKIALETIELYVDLMKEFEYGGIRPYRLAQNESGRLYQRKDFTFEVLLKAYELFNQKSFYQHYLDSLMKHGSPKRYGDAEWLSS